MYNIFSSSMCRYVSFSANYVSSITQHTKGSLENRLPVATFQIFFEITIWRNKFRNKYRLLL